MNNERTIREIIDLSKTNVFDGIYIYDFEKEEDLDTILMGQVYRQALRTIGKIVSNFSDEKGSSEESSSRYHVSNKKVLTNYSNIVPLIGGRGTGKTSALETIVQFLGSTHKSTRGYRNRLLFEDSCNNIYPKFTVLDCIDADRLMDNESVFENVIMRMYKTFEDRVDELTGFSDKGIEYKQRTLAAKFEELLKSYSKKNTAGVTYIQELRETSEKVSIRNKFLDLVNDFLAFIYDKEGKKDTFLIVPIDDLDSNVRSAYEMMEEIHQYLMLNNIIVIVTMDLTQFSYICENHFSAIVPFQSIIIEESKKSDLEQYWKQYVSRITQNYVDKILPSENRIHLPGIHNENRKVYVTNFKPNERHLKCTSSNRNGAGDESKCNGSKDEKQLNELYQPIKRVILYKIFRRTGIICDGLGKKKHYYEPDTVRKVVSLVEYLNQMKIVMTPPYIGEGEYNGPFDLLQLNLDKLDEIEDILKVNLELIYKDVVERMEYEKLQAEKRDVFDEIRRQYRSRQHKEAFLRFQKELIDHLRGRYIGETTGEAFANIPSIRITNDYRELYSIVGNLEYSYGNYQYLLNVYSNYLDKKMIHIILALQTANMTSLYNSILLTKIRRKALQEKNINSKTIDVMKQVDKELIELFIDLRQVIGPSASGDWFKHMLYVAAKTSKVQNQNCTFYPQADDYRNTIELFEGTDNPTYEERNYSEISFEFNIKEDEDLEELSSLVESIFILVPKADITIEIKEPQQAAEDDTQSTEGEEEPQQAVEVEAQPTTGDQEKALNKVIITVQLGDANTDELGFIMWYFDSLRSYQRIDNNLHLIHHSEISDDLEERIKKKLKRNCPECSRAPLPFYSQDFYYNLLKRLRDNKDLHFDSLNYKFLDYYSNGPCDESVFTEMVFKICEAGVTKDSMNMIGYAVPYLKVLYRIDHLLKKEDTYYNDERDDDQESISNQNNDSREKLINLNQTYRNCHFINNIICHEGNEKADAWSLRNLAIIGHIIYTQFTKDISINPSAENK